ncbi:hypothetical protein ABC977_03215 [Thioalkalicoccus limnaeus]|uniref:Uncharacterized protein n=1 Tax=Thioalkalicoccus limnaeus TaxID=120681 RepID=A0ABV4BDT6_9GAMM
MPSVTDVELAVWRAASGHAPLSASVGAIALGLGGCLPLRHMRILVFDPDARRVTPLAAYDDPAPESPVAALPDDAWERLLAWCRTARPVRGPATDLARRLPGLIPRGWRGEILMIGLVIDAAPLGAWVLGAPGRVGGSGPARKGSSPH